MYPTIKSCNDTLIGIEPNSRKDIKIGDIIWFRGTKEQIEQYTDGTEHIYHRIKEIDYKGCYVTKGDNNDEEDKYTPCFYDIKFKIVGVIYE
jgi:signal peptidase I